MGIIGHVFSKIAEKIVVGKAVETVAYGYEKAVAYTENKEKEIRDEFLGLETSHQRLIIEQRKYTFRESFKIFDQNKNVKYVVKGKMFSSTHKLTLFDHTGKKKLGEVNEKLIALRSLFSLESRPKDFVVKIGNKKIGKIKSKYAFGKRKFEFNFNGWIIDGNIFGSKYKVFEGKDVVMEVCKKIWFNNDVYFLDITDEKNEILCLLVALAIDSSCNSKSKDTERTIRHKRSCWI